MPKPDRGLFRATREGKPGEEGKHQYFNSLEELQAAFPDTTGVKIKRFEPPEDEDGEDVDPAAPPEEGTPV